jgi:hypothetical protein
MAEKKTVLLRLSPQLYNEINRMAQNEFRSVNGQIEYLLNEAVKKAGKTGALKDLNKEE